MCYTGFLTTETNKGGTDTLVDEKHVAFGLRPWIRKPTFDRLIGASTAMVFNFALGHMETRIACGTSIFINTKHEWG